MFRADSSAEFRKAVRFAWCGVALSIAAGVADLVAMAYGFVTIWTVSGLPFLLGLTAIFLSYAVGTELRPTARLI